jgi:uncharacterized membrane protein YtjA (UPF0391 family)
MGPSCGREDKAPRPPSGRDGCVPVGTTRPNGTLALQQRLSGTTDMLKWALFFFIISIIAALFGFTGIAAAAAGIAKILFFIFIVICVIFLVLGLMAGRAIF